MSDFIKTYNLNSFYICLLLLVYNIWHSNSYYINIILHKIYLLNFTSSIMIINIIGLCIFLNSLSIEVNVSCSLKFK